MFTDLFNRLMGQTSDPVTEIDARLGMAGLLVRIAKSDAQYAVSEIQQIDRILAHRFTLNPVEAAKLRAEAEEVERHAPDTVRFTRAIKDSVPYEDRTAVVEALWHVVWADGIRNPEEDAMLRLIAPMLGVSDQDSARARQRVMQNVPE